MPLITAILSIYSWLAAAGIVLFLFLIARFYEKKSDQRSYFWLFSVPAVLFILSGFRFGFGDARVVDWVGNGLLFVAGVALIVLGNFLLGLMMGRRR